MPLGPISPARISGECTHQQRRRLLEHKNPHLLQHGPFRETLKIRSRRLPLIGRPRSNRVIGRCREATAATAPGWTACLSPPETGPHASEHGGRSQYLRRQPNRSLRRDHQPGVSSPPPSFGRVLTDAAAQPAGSTVKDATPPSLARNPGNTRRRPSNPSRTPRNHHQNHPPRPRASLHPPGSAETRALPASLTLP
jgi:hypothetical protein